MADRTHGDERTPLLSQQPRAESIEQQERGDHESQLDQPIVIDFEEDDPENPRNWPRRRKMANILVIALIAILSPLASSMFTPGIREIARDLHCSIEEVVGATTAYVVLQGFGPLILAPLSETFGRRPTYMVCFVSFSLLQLPLALAPNVKVLIAARAVAGFFGSVSVANGGGTISDMFADYERSGIFGWYLLGPLLGPTVGPVLGGLIVQYLSWRWVFWVLFMICCFNTLLAVIFLRESYGPSILARRCRALAAANPGKTYTFPREDRQPLRGKLAHSLQRPLRILFSQPIVITMALYQACIFATLFSLTTNWQDIFSAPPYGFNSIQIGLLFLGPGLGSLTAVWFIVPHVDTVYNRLTARNKGKSKPEYRLPLANIGAVVMPLSLVWFAIAVDRRVHWALALAPTVFLGLGQVTIFNTVQNYYIDAFETYAASAIAAGAVARSLIGGALPLFAPELFRRVGYGWGWGLFAAVSFLLAPSPVFFMIFGERIRKRFAIEL